MLEPNGGNERRYFVSSINDIICLFDKCFWLDMTSKELNFWSNFCYFQQQDNNILRLYIFVYDCYIHIHIYGICLSVVIMWIVKSSKYFIEQKLKFHEISQNIILCSVSDALALIMWNIIWKILSHKNWMIYRTFN